MAIITGVIFDYSTLLIDPQQERLINELRKLLSLLKTRGLSITVVSTHEKPINNRLAQLGFPPADMVITRQDVGKPKGSPEWIYEVANRLNVESHQLLMIGDDAPDWQSAINSATVYLHAKWMGPLPERVTAIGAPEPQSVWRFATHFLLVPPRWEYAFDVPEIGLSVRSLLGSDVRLPASSETISKRSAPFTLQDIFTYNNKVKVGPYSGRDLLMLHAITSLYLEGLIEPRSWFAVYPSSTPGKKSPILREFLESVAKLFHGYFKEDLLVRAAKAVDSSLEKATAKKEGRAPNIPETNQTNTVHVHPDYKSKLRGRSVIVFDDFTTSGSSLEWARNLLYAAGARHVTLLTIGKYPLPYIIHGRKANSIIKPFERRDYQPDMLFEKNPVNLQRDLAGQRIIRESFTQWIKKEPLNIP